MGYSNSPLVSYTQISPNKNSPRNHAIDTITIHCYVGQVSVESMGNWFRQYNAECSCNYGIGSDGRIGLFVDEQDRSWCSSSESNDNRAITIECASDMSAPFAVNSNVYNSLITLLADICKRNNIPELRWQANPDLIGQVDKQNMTVHKWFANKDCPGEYLYSRHYDIANRVNALLGKTEDKKTDSTTSNAKIIWDFFKGAGFNNFVCAGFLGNLYAESNLNPRNMENSFETKLNFTDKTYTKAVDNGTYNNFINDKCGYGLAQWTFHTRKKALLNYAKQKNTSIGNIHTQLEFLLDELSLHYKSLLEKFETINSVESASNAILFDFERPADCGLEVQRKRKQYSEKFYKQFVNKDIGTFYRVQVGVFTYKNNADKLISKLKSDGFDAIFVYTDGMYKVQAGAFSKKENAETLLEKLHEAGYKDAFIKI